jgi:hypothetical protein
MQIINAYFKGFTYLKWLMFILISLLVILSLANQAELFYCRHYPFEPLKLYGVKIISPDVLYRPGDSFCYEVDFEKKMDLAATVKRQLHNQIVHFYANTEPPNKKLNVRQHVRFSLPIPSNALPGEHRLHWSACYEIGPEKREVCTPIESGISNPFYVVSNHDERSEGKRGPVGKTGKTGATGLPGKDGGFRLFR